MFGFQLRSGVVRLLAAVAIALFGVTVFFADGALRPAHAQEMTVEFRETLGAYGQWVEHPRWGAVWLPANITPDWRPYRLGHWVYTDEWGWYWVADEEWGWIAYHYGRWVFDRDLRLGWIWVPGTEWSPAWVTWRRGEETVGWAPMPPEEIYVAVQDEPDFWLFVRAPDIIAPSLAIVILPAPQAILYVRQTVIINQTVIIRQNNTVIVANPGVPPSFVAAKIGRPIQTVSVQPHVVRGTVGVTGAVVGAPPRGAPMREVIKPEPKLIQPAAHIPPPTPFRPGQHPNFGPDAPNALKRANLAPSGPAGGPGGPGGTGASGVQSGSGKPSPAISSRTPGAGPNNLRPPPGNLQTGPRYNQPTGPANVGPPGQPKPRTSMQPPGGNPPGTNQPPQRVHPQTGPANVGPQGPSSKPLATHTPSNQPPSNLQRVQPPPSASRQPPSGSLNQPSPHPQPNVISRPSPGSPSQSSTTINRGPPPPAPPAQRPQSPPQNAVVHQPPPPPQRSASPPPQHQQKCQTINGQQVCR
jgi:hypothetical protein